jgi:hypothetical protein
MQKISRKEAIQLGLKLFFTGNPCKRGHICERRATKGDCIECHRLNGALQYSAKLMACDPERAERVRLRRLRKLRKQYFQLKYKTPVPEPVQVREANQESRELKMENGPIS